ncbi:MAG: CHAT domain-containing protein [Pseudohongiellaceae bacterium]
MSSVSSSRRHDILHGILFLGVFIAASVNAQQSPDTVIDLQADALNSEDRLERLHALWSLADLYREQGKLREALRTISATRDESLSEVELTITDLRESGIALGLGLTSQAEILLASVRARSNLLNSRSRIVLLLEEGNFDVEDENLTSAIRRFEEAATAAQSMPDPALEARARINALRANLENRNLSGIEDQFDAIDALIASLPAETGQVCDEQNLDARAPALPANEEKALLALSVGDLYRRAVKDYRAEPRLILDAYSNYELARSNARSPASCAYALGFLGSLYEDEGRFDEALRFSTQAIFYAQAADEPEQHYRWEWQLGRILRAQGVLNETQAADARDVGNIDESEAASGRARESLNQSRAAYERAVAILNQVRSNFVLGSRGTFDTLVGPVYTEYADVLMLQAAAMPNIDQQRVVLRQVRSQLEELKQAEIEDYFASECAVTTDVNLGPGASTDSRVAVIYPLILDDRLEVVVEAGGDIQRFSVAGTSRGLVTRTIRRFRLALQQANSEDAYLAPAQQLYQWLIEPSLPLLLDKDVETLIIVPGGALRTVPMAALHDGEQFLIERYAVATTPAIALTETQAGDGPQNLLIGGLTEGRQGFIPLPNVGREIDTIAGLMSENTQMRDDTFLLQTVEEQLGNSDFSIAHFATHGQFSGDYTQSFILTYDDRLTLTGLRDILAARGDDPLDLLVLSACETAAGDDRAALGLAGVAVQSGAKSVIASLWQINDSATTELISDFYRNLSPDSTKAVSLQQAQLSLMATDNWKHPAYWAPFLLIGSWR